MESGTDQSLSFDLHAADERIVDVILIQILDEIACRRITRQSAFIRVGQV
jgi:hypothetical protein